LERSFRCSFNHVLSGEENLDIRSKIPTTVYFKRYKYDSQEKERIRLFTVEMKKDAAFYVFVSGNCPYCHKQMDSIHKIRATSGIYVQVVSKDFCPSDFPNCRVSPKSFEAFGVSVTPTIIMVVKNKEGKPEFYTISRGLAPYSQIVKTSTYFYKYSKTKKIPEH